MKSLSFLSLYDINKKVLKKLPKFIPLAIFSLTLYAPSVFAHEGEEGSQTAVFAKTLEDTLRSNSIKIVAISTAVILIFVVATILLKNASSGAKKILFVGIVLPTLLTTFYLVGSTLYLNFTSSSGGPVHWHADFEIWDCGTKLDIKDPQGFSNKVGTATYHEHNDDRLHVEGVITKTEEAALGRFFQYIGGRLESDEMAIPTNAGSVTKHNGDLCNDTAGEVQVFVYKTQNGVYYQSKLADPASYILSPQGTVPPGDCIIIEFDNQKQKTDHLCNFYKLKVETGELKSDETSSDQDFENNDLEKLEEDNNGN